MVWCLINLSGEPGAAQSDPNCFLEGERAITANGLPISCGRRRRPPAWMANSYRHWFDLCCLQAMPARAPLPDVVINTSGDRFGFLVCERRPWQRLPEVVKDEYLHLGLS